MDVKYARKYDGNLVFDEGVEKNFKEYAEGQGGGPGLFDPADGEEEANDPWS